jgi:Excalibur calcium-binding domain
MPKLLGRPGCVAAVLLTVLTFGGCLAAVGSSSTPAPAVPTPAVTPARAVIPSATATRARPPVPRRVAPPPRRPASPPAPSVRPPAPPVVQPPPPSQPSDTSADVYYPNCAAARAAGAAPILRGQPGYRRALDRDNDGVACET